MKDKNSPVSGIARHFYRAKLGLTRYFPNKDNLPFSLLSERLVEKRVQQSREKVADRRLIFTISPGRAGSEYLATLLDTAGNVAAFHEPLPRMNGRYLEMAMNRPLRESYGKRRIKLLGINHSLSRLHSNTVYAETSHMFIKSYHDVALEYYRNVDVIVLRRPMHKVLKSFIELGFFSESNPVSPRWMHDPGSANCVAEPLKPVEEMDQYEKCIAYLLDIEARAQDFNNSYPNVKTHDVMLESISGIAGAKQLFAALGAEWTSDSDSLYSKVVNRRTVYKTAIGGFCSEEYCRERIDRYVRQAKNAGISIPEIRLP